MTDFFPSAKDITKRKVAGLMRENKNKTDEEIRQILKNNFGVRLSRRSVNVYRNEILKTFKTH
jgi:DNA-directed RNA polymerase specialized sigma54-like protein